MVFSCQSQSHIPYWLCDETPRRGDRRPTMQSILGPFHPYLENAIVEEISKYKSADPLCPLLVLLPSGVFRRRLKILFARDGGLSLVNLELLTFFHLSFP